MYRYLQILHVVDVEVRSEDTMSFSELSQLLDIPKNFRLTTTPAGELARIDVAMIFTGLKKDQSCQKVRQSLPIFGCHATRAASHRMSHDALRGLLRLFIDMFLLVCDASATKNVQPPLDMHNIKK